MVLGAATAAGCGMAADCASDCAGVASGAAGCEAGACCAAALKAVSNAAVRIQFVVRMTLISRFENRFRFTELHPNYFAKTF
jgi:hypothetical protein